MVRLINNANSFISILVIVFSLITPGLVKAKVFKIPPGNVAKLIEAINEANSNNEADTIKLKPGIYTLTEVNNITNGPNGLPSITSNITIIGSNKDSVIIERDIDADFFRIFHIANNGILTIDSVTIAGGAPVSDEGFDDGGGIFNNGELTVTRSNIINNESGLVGSGGGIFNNSGGVTRIIYTIIASNDATGPANGTTGGGIHNSGILEVSHSTVERNVTHLCGGGICNSGSANISNSVIRRNQSLDKSGGIGNSGTLSIINSTIERNAAGFDQGGGVSNQGGNVTIINSTISNNSSGNESDTAGGVYNANGHVEIQNTIIALNSSDDAFGPAGPDCLGSISSLGNNIIGDTTGCTITLQATDLTGDPGLGDFTDNGTPGNGHFPLLATSQAIDEGNSDVCLDDPILTTDQIGQPRRDGDGDGTVVCDIGAIEFQPPFKNKGQCISLLIKENCSGLKGKNRATCNHQQQQFCKNLFK